MPAIAAITVVDGAAANRSYTPQTTNGASAKWLSRAEGVTIELTPNITFDVRNPASKVAPYRVVIGVGVPEEDVDVTASLSHVNSASVAFNFAQKSSAAERNDVRARLVSYLTHGDVVDAIENLEPFF